MGPCVSAMLWQGNVVEAQGSENVHELRGKSNQAVQVPHPALLQHCPTAPATPRNTAASLRLCARRGRLAFHLLQRSAHHQAFACCAEN